MSGNSECLRIHIARSIFAVLRSLANKKRSRWICRVVIDSPSCDLGEVGENNRPRVSFFLLIVVLGSWRVVAGSGAGRMCPEESHKMTVGLSRGSVMKDSYVDGACQASRGLNAVALQNAVLCAECDVVSDSPHDRCLVCGSRSLFNIARLFGGNLPKDRASLIESDPRELTPCEMVLNFPEPYRLRAKAAG